MNFYPAIALLRHRLISKSPAGHGVHSPYIYDFLTTGIRNKLPEDILLKVESLRRDMLEDERRIMVTDLGSGSVRGMTTARAVKDIAKYCALPAKQVSLLTATARYAQKERDDSGIILELGTSLGISTLSLALALPGRRIITIEGCPRQAEIAQHNLARYGAENVVVMNMEFADALMILEKEKTNVSFAFIDGNHRGSALKEYARAILEMSNHVIIVADDVHLSRDMYQGWRELTEEKTADAFMETKRFGMLFKRANLTPGNYKIWC